jgi:hypothetical protein
VPSGALRSGWDWRAALLLSFVRDECKKLKNIIKNTLFPALSRQGREREKRVALRRNKEQLRSAAIRI